jgi:tagaturonate reductase
MIEASLPTLSLALLDQLRQRPPENVDLPPVSILSAPETVLQIGSGGFLRGFVEDFLQTANSTGDLCGRVASVQRKPDRRQEIFARQNGLYTLVLRGLQDGRPAEVKRIVASTSRLLSAEIDWQKVIAAVRQPSVRTIVSNVTEAGLTLDPADTPTATPPVGYAGKLTQLLWERWRTNKDAVRDLAVVPCELAEDNGSAVRKLIAEQADAWNLPPEFSAWVAASVHFANTLVDRIVIGSPSPESLETEWRALGYRDDLIVGGELFALFALQADEFVRKHFPLDRASPSVRFVADLLPYRRRKVRILNGPHTILAAIGRLLGLKTVLAAMEHHQLGRFIRQTIFQEVIPAMDGDEELQVMQYACEIIERFRNPFLEHQLLSICLNCSTKTGIRLFPTVRDYMKRRGSLPQRLLFGLAAVMLVSRDPDVQDTHAEQIGEMWRAVVYESPGSMLAFVENVLASQVNWSHEEIDVKSVAPPVAGFLVEVHDRGLRAVMESHFGDRAREETTA